MKYSISLNFKYLSVKMIGKNEFSIWKKWNFEPIGNSVHTAKCLALGKVLLPRLYLQVKVYTDLLSVHNLLSL